MENLQILTHYKGYSQLLGVRCACSNFDGYKRHLSDLVKIFVEKGYKANTIPYQVKNIENLGRSTLLNNFKTYRKTIPFSIAYNPNLLNAKEIIN